MRSRADVARRLIEWVLRGASLVAMLLLAVRLARPHPIERVSVTARSGDLAGALPGWTLRSPDALTLALDSVPTPPERDWLRALARGGTAVTWTSSTLAPTAVSVSGLADPVGVRQVDLVTPGGRAVLRDAIGVIDTVEARGAVHVLTRGGERGASLAVAGTVAAATLRDSLVLRRLLVEGTAGWETKFTIAALQERGWQVDAITHIAPGVDVRVGAPAALDTARYSAAVAVDTSAQLIAAGAARFVASGGGLVTLRDADAIGPRGGGGIQLERTSTGEVRGSKFGGGRILRVTIPDLWRMRMAAGDSGDAAERHRTWFATAVASVAYAPGAPVRVTGFADPAPYADLVATLGVASVPAPGSPAVPHNGPLAAVPDAWLAAIALGGMLVEIVSRRARGAA